MVAAFKNVKCDLSSTPCASTVFYLSCRMSRGLHGTQRPIRLLSQFLTISQWVLVWLFEHLELQRTSVSQVPFNFLPQVVHHEFLSSLSHFFRHHSQVAYSFHYFFVFLEISGWLNKLERERNVAFFETVTLILRIISDITLQP